MFVNPRGVEQRASSGVIKALYIIKKHNTTMSWGAGVLTLSVLYVELVYLLSELILLNGLRAWNRKRKTPFKVLHLIHGDK